MRPKNCPVQLQFKVRLICKHQDKFNALSSAMRKIDKLFYSQPMTRLLELRISFKLLSGSGHAGTFTPEEIEAPGSGGAGMFLPEED